MKIFILVIILVILLSIFLPIYKGNIHCGINPDQPCFNEKLNLIEYIEYKNQSNQELLKECPDEMIWNKMPSSGFSNIPSSYYIKNGVRSEISEYDGEWVRANCTVPVQEIY